MTSKIKRFYGFVLLVSCVLLSACGGGGSDGSDPAVEVEVEIIDGADVYMNPQPAGNVFACAHCHALSEPATDGFDRAGHAIGDALRRPSYKNGELFSFLDAANTCLETWMDVSQAWGDDSPDFVALTDFLSDQDVGAGAAPVLSFVKKEPLTFESDNSDVFGDAEFGREKFNNSCALCHGEDAVGTERAPKLAGEYDFAGSANVIARKVRLSGPVDHQIYDGDSVGGVMPFWVADRLGDGDLEDVIAFIIGSESLGAPPSTETGGSSCTSTHPNIGQQATLSTLAHNVSGVATIIDDCTIRIDSFNFDGGGINIRVYGGDGDFSSTGFIMSDNLLNQVYTGGSLTVTLPAGKTLDDIDRISIWCVPVGVSFGDGVFSF